MSAGVRPQLLPDVDFAPVANTSARWAFRFDTGDFVAIVPSAVNTTVTPGTGTLTLTGFAPTVATPRLVTPTTKALTLTGFAPTVATPRLVTPGTKSLTLTGFAPTVATPRLVTPATGALVLTGFAPTVSTPRAVTPNTASLVLTGFAPTVEVTTGAGVEVTPDTATLTLTGYEPTITIAAAAGPDTRTLSGIPAIRKRRRDTLEVSGTGSIPSFGFARIVGEAKLSGSLLIPSEGEATVRRESIVIGVGLVRVGAEDQITGECGISASLNVPPMAYARGVMDQHASAAGVFVVKAYAEMTLDRSLQGRMTAPTGIESRLTPQENEDVILIGAAQVIIKRLTAKAPSH